MCAVDTAEQIVVARVVIENNRRMLRVLIVHQNINVVPAPVLFILTLERVRVSDKVVSYPL